MDTASATKTSPRDFFLHLLAIATLYISAVSFGTLLFQFINVAFPDPLSYMSGANIAGPIRWALASLVIVFPVYLWVSWFLARDAVAHPEKRELRVRKWLFYFTLFAAAAVIIGDLVTLIYNFLGGDLSMRFILKVIAVLFIAASVFGYYIWNVRVERMASRDPRMRIFIFAIIILVAASVVYGFFVAGSPFAERLRRFDEERAADLQNIQWQVVNYWQRKVQLPKNLDDLRDNISGYVAPKDPESGVSYEYTARPPLSFELCAVFTTDSASQPGASKAVYPASTFDNWQHGIGRTCFLRTIDPELYPATRK